jgi:hypothetical protein
MHSREGLVMKTFGLTAVLCALALCAAMPSSAAAQDATAEPDAPNTLTRLEAPYVARKKPAQYFIEFRSRSALSYGHTFVVHGRVGEKLSAKNVAGLHPRGDSSITYILGHILLVPSETGASDGDLDEQYMTARYRVMLSAAQYRTIVGHIRELQANSPAWNAVTYNCNAFAGTIAHFVGLTSPPTWLLPEDFVNSLRAMNSDTHPAAAQPIARRSSRRVATWGPDLRDNAGAAMARQVHH